MPMARITSSEVMAFSSAEFCDSSVAVEFCASWVAVDAVPLSCAVFPLQPVSAMMTVSALVSAVFLMCFKYICTSM